MFTWACCVPYELPSQLDSLASTRSKVLFGPWNRKQESRAARRRVLRSDQVRTAINNRQRD